LIRPQAWVELAHERWIGMAASAQLRNLLAIDLSLPTGLAAHRLIRIIAGWIAPMTTRACETFLGVDVLAELFLGDS
jgi:hypothetical protein